MNAFISHDGTKTRMSRLARVAISGMVVAVTFGMAIADGVADSPAPPVPETQAIVKPLGFGVSRITLQPRAASRLDIRTGLISEDQSGRRIVPYSSVIYDLDGDAWVYTVTAPLTFVREAIVVEQITKDFAYILEGPPAGTQVVTVGVPELYGTEVGVNGE
jgi:hypothetical protein